MSYTHGTDRQWITTQTARRVSVWVGGGGCAQSASEDIFRAKTYLLFSLIQSDDDDADDDLMNEIRRKPTTGRQSPSLSDKWRGIFYNMPSHLWGLWVQFREWDSNRQRIGSQGHRPNPLSQLPQEQRETTGTTWNNGSPTRGKFGQSSTPQRRIPVWVGLLCIWGLLHEARFSRSGSFIWLHRSYIYFRLP